MEERLGNNELSQKLFVLAGMADKRKSRVNHKIFMSRKASRPSKSIHKEKLNVYMDKKSSSYTKQARKSYHQRDTPSFLGA